MPTQVLELLRGLVKVSSSVARNYSTSHLSDMRTGGAGGSANYDDLSLISAQFHAEVGRWMGLSSCVGVFGDGDSFFFVFHFLLLCVSRGDYPNLTNPTNPCRDKPY